MDVPTMALSLRESLDVPRAVELGAGIKPGPLI